MIKLIKKDNFEPLVNWIELRKDKFYKIAWSYMYNHQDVEDILQESILKAYEGIDTLKDENYDYFAETAPSIRDIAPPILLITPPMFF